ncbi:hypothetical protein L2E68_04070 [Planktothrix agardhii 1029]|nr:Bpu10I family restriction endonuclease [Planktothrix agardhii]MCB8758643.1 hypothetical protein [Planktothrix agardhii 1813]MCB8765618.1 hypothetical protein [Planktothrix agardhii 1809]MCF3588670.1 hypothetical protein [Planktothrix agardhii 1029]MCF3622052.1 hypothetical protein [Planktothrix agardhii 1030]
MLKFPTPHYDKLKACLNNPQLIYRSLQGIDDSFEIGPQNTFSGLSFLSS